MTRRRMTVIVLVVVVLGLGAALLVDITRKKPEVRPSVSSSEELRPPVSSRAIDEMSLPRFITADFIELDKVENVSPFRSGGGHDYSADSSGETCRSKKHYFSPTMAARGGAEANKRRKELDARGETVPPPDESLAAKIFSPVDGIIFDVSKTHWGDALKIKPADQPAFVIEISHVFLYPGTTEGMTVKAGQRIAYTGNSTDMSITWSPGLDAARKVIDPTDEWFYVSYFSVMTDSVFAAYKARGVKDRGQMVVSREWRDAHPFECDGGTFLGNYEETRPEDTVFTLTPVDG